MNRSILPLLLATVSLNACASSGPPRPVAKTVTVVEAPADREMGTATMRVDGGEPVPLGPDGSFEPSVSAAAPTDGECFPLPEAAGGPGVTVLALPVRTADDVQRAINVTVDASGKVVAYSDTRGDLLAGGGNGPVTAIFFDLREGAGMVLDVGADGTRRSHPLPSPAALDRTDLGEPNRVIDVVLDRCGEA